jgi:hypothetical protein
MNLSIVICLLYSTLDFSTLDICLNAIILLTIKRGFNYCYYQSCFLKCRSCSYHYTTSYILVQSTTVITIATCS